MLFMVSHLLRSKSAKTGLKDSKTLLHINGLTKQFQYIWSSEKAVCSDHFAQVQITVTVVRGDL